MKDKEHILKEWYETGEVADGEEVMSSNMPDSFQQMRSQNSPPQKIDVEIEVEKKQLEQPEPETIESKNIKEVYIKMGVLYDTLSSYHMGVERGDEPMQLEFLKEKLKNLSVEVMRLIDGI